MATGRGGLLPSPHGVALVQGDGTDLRILARYTGISIATAYRYLHEVIDVIAARAPELADVLAKALREGWDFVCLDGTLIATDRYPAVNPETGHDLWYSDKTQALRRERPSPLRTHRLPRMGHTSRTGLDPRHQRRPHPRALRALRRRSPR